ncbi:MAG TPA: prohibitin family protein [Trueperaceae bacterium]|nr:prohibitin family protein [Trueperaceae bacterium]
MLTIIGLAIVLFGVILIIQGIQGQKTLSRSLGGLAIIAGVLIAFFANAFVIVPPGRTGVVFNVIGGVQEQELSEGFHIVLPFLQRVTLMDTRKQTIDFVGADDISALSKEGLQIVTDATIIYRIDGTKAAELYQTVGTNYQNSIIRPTVRSKLRDVMAEFNAAELISTKRQEMQVILDKSLRDALQKDNIFLEELLVRDIRIPARISQAIEEKQAAEQEVQVEVNRREQAKIAAERAKITAEGERDAAIARAQGEAEALTLKGKAIRENPEIIQLEVAQRLAPSIQTIMLPAEGNFLLDMKNLIPGR